MQDERAAFGLQFGHGLGVGLYEAPMISPPALVRRPGRARGRDGVRARDVLRRLGRPLGGADRGGGHRHAERAAGDHALPGRRAARRRPELRARRRLRASGPVGGTTAGTRRRRRPTTRRADDAPADPPRGRRAAPGAARPQHRTDPGGPARGAHRRHAHRAVARSSSPTGTSTRTCTRSRRPSTCSRASRCSTWRHGGAAGAGRVRGDPGRHGARVASGRGPLDRDGVAAAARARRAAGHVLPRAGARHRAGAARPARSAQPATCSFSAERHGPRPAEAGARPSTSPKVSASMATAALAYSGITVKMLVDKRLDAQLQTMFMVGYQPGAVAHPHDHPFEESYFMLEGEVDVVADGERYTLRPGDVFWTGVGCIHAFYETKGRRCCGSRRRRPGRRTGTRTASSATGSTSPSSSRDEAPSRRRTRLCRWKRRRPTRPGAPAAIADRRAPACGAAAQGDDRAGDRAAGRRLAEPRSRRSSATR